MATYTVSASADDSTQQSIPNDSGRAVTGSGAVSTTDTLLSPGSHASNDERSVAARFTGVAVAQGATITSASFSLKPQTSYSSPGTIAYLVSAQASDNAPALTTSGGDLNAATRPRTTAVSAVWNQTAVTAGVRQSIDITSVIQEIVNRAGWTSGNAIVIIVDTDPSTTLNEWQDYYAWDDATDRVNNPPQLTITTGGGTTHTSDGAGTLPALTAAAQAGPPPEAPFAWADWPTQGQRFTPATLRDSGELRELGGIAASSFFGQTTSDLTAAATLPGLAASAQAAATAPAGGTFASDGAGTLPALTAAGQTSAAAPTYAGQAAATLGALQAAGQASATAPSYAGQGAATLGALQVAGAASYVVPSVSATAAGTLPALTGSGQAAASLPTFTSQAAATLPAMAAAGQAAPTAPSYAGQAAGTIPALTGAGLGGFVAPGASTNWNVTVGSGYTDVSPKQLIRTSGDVLLVFGVDCSSYPCTNVAQTIRAYRASASGVPSSFTRLDSAHEPAGIAGWAVAVDGSDVVHVVYAERTTSGGNVANLKYTTFDAGSGLWSGTVEAIASSMNTTTDGQGDQLVSLALDSSGVPHIAYLQGNGSARRLYYRNRVGGTWSTATQLDSGATYTGNRRAWHPALAFDAAGRILAAWAIGAFNNDTDGSLQTVVRSSGGSWGSIVQVATGQHVGIDQSTSLLVTPDGAYHVTSILPETVSGSVQLSYIQYWYSTNQGGTWTANHPGGGTQATHNPAFGYAAGKVRIYGHGTPDNLGHGDNLYYFEGAGGSGAWGSWTQIVTGAYDSSVNVRWAQFFQNSPNTWDIAYWSDAYPNNLFAGTQIATAPTFSAAGAATLGALTGAGQAAAAAPSYAGQAAGTIPAATAAGQASAAAPTYAGQGAATLGALQTAGAASYVVPSVSGQGGAVLPALTGAAQASATAPSYASAGGGALPSMAMAGSATAAAPSYVAQAAATLPAIVAVAVGAFTIPTSTSAQGGGVMPALIASGVGGNAYIVTLPTGRTVYRPPAEVVTYAPPAEAVTYTPPAELVTYTPAEDT